MTVSGWTSTSRAVLRTPQPSAMWCRIERIFSSGKWARYSGVPLRSEKRAWQVRQYSRRYWWCLPSRPVTVRFPGSRRPKSGHREFWQQNRARSSMVRCAGSKEERERDLRRDCHSRHYCTFFNLPGSRGTNPGRMLKGEMPLRKVRSRGRGCRFSGPKGGLAEEDHSEGGADRGGQNQARYPEIAHKNLPEQSELTRKRGVPL